MNTVKSVAGFALGGLAIVAALMVLQVYVGGYTYRNTPPIGNLIFGVIILTPYVLCGSAGFAFALHIFGISPRAARSLLAGAGFVATLGLADMAVNHFAPFNLFNYDMIAVGTLVFFLAVPWTFLSRPRVTHG